MTIKVTLNQIRSHHPCESGWIELLKHLGKTSGDDEEFPLVTVLDSNGMRDALWCLRCVERKQVVELACRFAERALIYVPRGETRPAQAIETARKWCRGEASLREVRIAAYAVAYATAAYAAAAYAAADAAYAAYAAAYAAADAAYAAYAVAYATAAYAEREEQERIFREWCDGK